MFTYLRMLMKSVLKTTLDYLDKDRKHVVQDTQLEHDTLKKCSCGEKFVYQKDSENPNGCVKCPKDLR